MFLSNKIKFKERITLTSFPMIQNIISNDKEVDETFNEFFSNVTKTLKIFPKIQTSFPKKCQTNPVLQSIEKCSK